MLSTVFSGPNFQREASPLSALDTIGWWERRRLFFNLAIGSSGVGCCILMVLCAVVSQFAIGEPIGIPDGPLLGIFAIFAYAIMANICYTAGWLCELIMRSLLAEDRVTAYALNAFRFGIKFSIALTLLPAAICWISLAVMLITDQRPQPGHD